MNLTWLQYVSLFEFIAIWIISVRFFGRGYIPGLILCSLGIVIILLSITITPSLSWLTSLFGSEPSCTISETLYSVKWPCGNFIGIGYGLCAAAGSVTIWQFIKEKHYAADRR